MAVFITGGQAAERYDEHTLFLLHGADLVDSSMYGRTITNAGASESTSEVKFGSTSLYFELGDYLTIPAIDFGSGDFTVDWWEFVSSFTGSTGTRFTTAFSDNYGSKSGGLLVGCYEQGSKIYASSKVGTLSWDVIHEGNCFAVNAASKWVHRAVVRSGSILMIFTNGALERTYNIGTSVIGYNADCPFCIGRWAKNMSIDGYYFDGWINEFRISDVARWTANFTPPTEPYTA